LSIANCQLPIEKAQPLLVIYPIGNWQLKIGNVLADGRPAPAHMKLGAKWVEVRKRRDLLESNSKMKSEFETWPATPVEASLESTKLLCIRNQPELLLLKNEAAGVGRPSKARGQRSEIRGRMSEKTGQRELLV
jgi:hypothetical protein